MTFPKSPSISIKWGIFGLVTLLLNLLAHQQPEFVERWYSRGLFQRIRYTIDWTTGRLPFPVFYLFWIGVVVFWIILYRRRPRIGTLRLKVGYWLTRFVGFAGLILGLFFWMWGFNYARVPLKTQLGLQVQPLDSTALWQELTSETQDLNTLRTALAGNDTTALDDEKLWPIHAEDTIRESLVKWLESEHFPTNGRVRGRFIYPEGTLFAFGAAGIYWPFVGEGNVDAAIHPLCKLPAMAHEMSHGYGFSDEGVCNFLAYVSCYNHSNKYIAYCAHLDYWHTLARACLFNNPKRYQTQYRGTIPAGIVADERAIRRRHSRFGELAPELRYDLYDFYLKSQGIKAGMLSYDEVLMLVRAWGVARRLNIKSN